MIDNLKSFLRSSQKNPEGQALTDKQLYKIKLQAPTNVLSYDLKELTVSSFDYLFNPNYFSVREIYLFGSRKSAKTKHTALRFIVRLVSDSTYNALAMRKIASELSHSVKEELQWAINILGLNSLFQYKIQAREFIYKPTGQKILLKGISINPTSGKPALSGLNLSTGQIKDCWLEEAWEFTYADYKMIRQTLRGGSYTMLMIGNPYFESIWCVRRAIELCPPTLEELKEKGQIWKYIPKAKGQMETLVHWNNFQINTKLHPADIEERWAEEKENPKDFIVTGYGMYGSPSGTILGDLVDKIKFITLDSFLENQHQPIGGVDVGLVYDATAATYGATSLLGDYMFASEYYHSNGTKECNQMSNNGVWKKKSPIDIGTDVVEFFIMWENSWSKNNQLFRVAVDSADRAFIAILNRYCKEIGYQDKLKFVPTIGEQEGKKRIESRIIHTRYMLSHSKVAMVMIDNIVQNSRLLYEMNNIPWKVTVTNGEPTKERDGTKVHPDTTNSMEYAIRRRMISVEKLITVKGVKANA